MGYCLILDTFEKELFATKGLTVFRKAPLKGDVAKRSTAALRSTRLPKPLLKLEESTPREASRFRKSPKRGNDAVKYEVESNWPELAMLGFGVTILG